MNKKPHIVTIFGGTGDLTYRKLLPAFTNLLHTQNLPEDFEIVIIGRRDYTTESYRERVKPWLEKHVRIKHDESQLDDFLSHVQYFEMEFTEDDGYKRLKETFDTINPDADILYYFAVAPSFFEVIAEKLNQYNMVKNTKVIIEKPFGNDLESAQSINKTLTRIFTEDNIYRIDHYVAKEMVQNIFTIRFSNVLFQSIWDSEHIDNIQISANELVGVESRGNYYDHTGAMKDMFQNHLLQVLSIVTMDEPASMKASDIHHQQESILDHLVIKDVEKDVVVGQYSENKDSRSYRDEDFVDPKSTTETFVALKLCIDTPRWRETPIYVRTGKRMHKRSTEIVVTFKKMHNENPNVLIIKVQPDEGVYLRFNIKKPGQSQDVQTVFMDFCQSCNYENRLNTPEAYERLLNAALEEDHTLFASFKQVESSWAFVEKLIASINHREPEFYPAYTSGPQKAHELLERDGREWVEESVLGELQAV